MNHLSLNLRVILLVLVTSGILVGGMLLTVYQLMVSDYTVLVAERESAEIERLSSELELSQQQRVLGLEAFATRLLDDAGMLRSNQELQSILKQPSVASDLFPGGLLFFDADATAVAENQYVPGRLGTNYADRPHFQRAMQSKSAVISEPILGRTTGLPLISFLQPLLSSDNTTLGYVGGVLDLSNTPILSNSDFKQADSNAVTLVIDPRYRLFVSMQERFSSPEPLPAGGTDPLVDAAVAVSPAGTLVQYQQQKYLIASKQLDSLGWVVLRAIPYDEAIAPAKSSYLRFLLITLLAMFFVGAAGMRVARNLTQPIEIMTRRIDGMADNARFDSDFQEQGGPEVRALARAMNRLATERMTSDMAIREAKRFLSSVLEAASEVSIIATDCVGVITEFNKGAEKMLGYSKVEMVGKQTPAILHLPDEVEERAEQLSTELGRPVHGFRVFVEKAEQQGSETKEWTYVHKEGRHLSVSLVVTPMRNGSGEISGYLGIAEDISERKRMDLMKSEFISTVSHELRTPLTSISGALGLLVGGGLGELPEKANKLLQTAQRNCKRLAHLINDLLDIEKIATGKLHFDMQPQLLMPLLEQALESNGHYANQRGVTISLTGNAPDALVSVDTQRLMQILANLLSNAIKFSPNNDVVKLNVQVTGEIVTISVIDKGPGIADSFRGRIFQRFAQADSSDTRAKEGTGLGLAITRELVERMGGRIDFESTQGKGSCFFFELPLVQTDNKTSVNLQHSSNTGSAGRILVVEDDADIANLLSIMLNEAGYQVDIAYNVSDALSCLQNTHYDLVSLDLMLRGTSGLEIIRTLRKQPKTADLPIVVVSAKIEQGRLAFNGDVSNIDWLAKPIDQQRLIDIVKRQLSTRQGNHPRVLHIEDDEDLHEVICAMVGDQFDFELASTLHDARDLLERNVYDVVLLDIGLPDGSGWELLSEIRSCQPKAKVVILSGTDMTEQERERVEAVMLKSRLSTQALLDGIGARIQSFRSNLQ